MRIAYISTLRSAPWGGSEELWYQSAGEAIKSDHKLGVFIYDWHDEPKQISKLREQGAEIYKRRRNFSISKRIINKVSKNSFPSLNSYKDLVKFNPDIIVVTDGSTYYTVNDRELSELLLKTFKNRYVIISQSNTDYHLPVDRDNAIELFENACKVFFVAENNRRLAFHQLAYNLTKTSVIQNPVLLNSFEQRPSNSDSNEIHCAVVGRFCISDKGQDILIAMMADESFKSSNIKLHLYGNGSDGEYLKKLISFYNVTDKVIIEGFVNDRNLIWDKCQCLLMCSHAEGTPLTVLEAMIAGRVCIVTNVGGNNEWIVDGKNGFLVSAPNKDLFAAKLQLALNRINEWEALGKAAHDSAMKKIDTNPGKTLLNNIEYIISKEIKMA